MPCASGGMRVDGISTGEASKPKWEVDGRSLRSLKKAGPINQTSIGDHTTRGAKPSYIRPLLNVDP